MPEIIIAALVALLLGAGLTFFVTKGLNKNPGGATLLSAEAQAQEILDRATRESERIVKDGELRAKEDTFRRREELTRDIERLRNELRENERRVEKREDFLSDKQKDLNKKDQQLEQLQKKIAEKATVLDKKGKELDALLEEEMKKLQHITGLSRENAEKLLFDRLERQLTGEVALRLQQHEKHIKQTAEGKAREIIITAIQRSAADHTADTTVSTVDIPSDDVKGRIIGREGRNIRTFEKATGVDVIVDDTPGVVIVSAFDNVRRETARLALTKLIADGRIHPTRIEEVVAETQKEMETHILELGRQAVLDVDLTMPSEKILYLLGRLRFRTSYSQNVLNHSIEVAHLCGLIASEVGLDPRLARRCGLLHDIGKAADHEMEGGHPKVGAELAKRYGEQNADVLHAIIGHHDDVTISHPYTMLVAAADAISASRPGARRETLEKYVKRLENLEAVACGFPEVEAAFAIQAGRELRVIASSQRTSDADALRVCREIARAIEQQLDYPGEIKVTVIRETRSVDVAK
ncbi:ribonuclease Y [Limnoglobus roseus]|uniref:Ribonuclease Y n=1 Tax=Limnoglobus roseus TaxID=2598579 RepID=A0A5C1A5G8_9BACT|nr:ribonuclease Y [Limnoglobus roseus]QEL13593.1 ribonuclease Y [Limnoglobus roseus]